MKQKKKPGPGVEHGLHRQHSKSTRALPTCTNPGDFASISQNYIITDYISNLQDIFLVKN